MHPCLEGSRVFAKRIAKTVWKRATCELTPRLTDQTDISSTGRGKKKEFWSVIGRLDNRGFLDQTKGQRGA